MPNHDALPPDVEFDRHWAHTVLKRALAQVQADLESADRAAHFLVLKPWLTGEQAGLKQADAAEQLGLNENAVKVAIHRIRKQFHAAAIAEISHTLTPTSDAAEELAHLQAALRGTP